MGHTYVGDAKKLNKYMTTFILFGSVTNIYILRKLREITFFRSLLGAELHFEVNLAK